MLHFFKENRNIQRVINTRYDVIFYAENAYYFQYYRHLLEELEKHPISICYITSDKNDPILSTKPNIETVYSKNTLAFAFNKLKAGTMIMTMPDLENFIFKRSAQVEKYVYVFHALVSTNQQYRAHAFDHYDTIFSCGPHHDEEIREAERIYGLPEKQLIRYGYPLLQDLSNNNKATAGDNQVLVAPSWYDEGIFQTCIEELVEALAGCGRKTLVRPHPEFIKRNKKTVEKLSVSFQKHPHISFDMNPSLWQSILSSRYLITDRSGIAFEYAFVKQRPVLFIDTPPKIQNTDLGHFTSRPVENLFRDQIGISISPNELHRLNQVLDELDSKTALFQKQIAAVKPQVVYEEKLAQNGINYILGGVS
jgi:hypothetical protein